MSTAAEPRRGFLLTLIGVIGIIQGVLAVIGGLALIAERNDDGLLDQTDVSSTALGWTGGWMVVLGVITLIVAAGILRGSDIARTVLAVVEVLHIGGGLWVFIAQSGTERWDGLGTIIVALLILWILYRARSQAFFDARSESL